MTRHRLLTVVLLALSCAGSVAIVESGLRLYFLGSLRQPAVTDPLVIWQPHETRGWTLAPNVRAKFQTVDFVTAFRTNSRGLADDEHDYEPADGVTRIVVLGDSFMDASQVPFDAAFTRQLASRLAASRVEVINLGVAGYGTFQEYLYLVEEGFKYKPDIVLVAFYALNDVHNNSQNLSRAVWGPTNIQTFGRPYPDPNGGPGPGATLKPPDLAKLRVFHEDRLSRQAKAAPQSFLERSMMYQILTLNSERKSTEIWTPTADLNIYIGPILKEYSADFAKDSAIPVSEYGPLWTEAWDLTLHSLQLLQQACTDRHAALVVFAVPDKLQVEQGYRDLCARRWPQIQFDIDKPNRKLAEFCAAHSLLYLDLLPAFAQGEAKGRGPFFHVLRDRHWNAKGHALAAGVLTDFIREHGLIHTDNSK